MGCAVPLGTNTISILCPFPKSRLVSQGVSPQPEVDKIITESVPALEVAVPSVVTTEQVHLSDWLVKVPLTV